MTNRTHSFEIFKERQENHQNENQQNAIHVKALCASFSHVIEKDGRVKLHILRPFLPNHERYQQVGSITSRYVLILFLLITTKFLRWSPDFYKYFKKNGCRFLDNGGEVQ